MFLSARLALLAAAILLDASCGGSNSGTAPSLTAPAPQSRTNVLTYRDDTFRTGQNLTETVLSPVNVNSTSFGKLFTVTTDGNVDAQPLYVSQVTLPGQGTRAVVYAATEHASVYAFDSTTGTTYWQTSLLASGETPSDDRGCSQVSPEIGITATPVIDLTAGPHGTIYLLSMSKDESSSYHHRLHALDITTGQEEFGGPTEITATYPGAGDNSINGQVVFDAKQHKSRPGMLLLNGVLYTGWGSHCDIRPYTGWLMAYNPLTLQQIAVFNFAPNGSEAALWNSGGGIVGDPTTGRVFVSVANGTFDTTLNAHGFPNTGDFGNAFVRLHLSSGQFTAEDYWTMNNTVNESSQDEDLGSGGLVALPDLTNASGQIVQLATGAGKDGTIYVFNRQNMGKFNAQNDSTIYQSLSGSVSGGVFSSPAWFNGTLYYGAVGDRIRAFNVSAAMVHAQPASTTNTVFAYPGATPAISANGVNAAILWAVENTNPAVLHAYDATNLATEFYNSSQASGGRDNFGAGNKYITPAIADGHVIVGGTRSVSVFGLIEH